MRLKAWILACCVLLGCSQAVMADPVQTERYKGASELAARIDRLLAESWKKADVKPALVADDAEWVRRVYLDIAGRIPTVAEARAFHADKSSDKRAHVVEKLLAGQRYPTHFARVWRSLLLPEANSSLQVRFQVGSFEGWLREWLASDRGYDTMVRELVTAPVNGGRGGFRLGGTGQQAFYFAKEFKPEELASSVSRVFLGVNIGCAQCHNHPFADWKREQFWSFAAFFSGIESQRQGDFTVPGADRAERHELTIPGTERKVKAKYLDGIQPTFQKNDKVREVLANWMTAKDNPYFARAAVNRMWAHFFGTGLMEPLDEMVGTEVEPAQPRVLDELSVAFAERGYDMRWLIRTITATRAYHLSSARSHPGQDDAGLFARAALRGLSGEQLFDSLATATGFSDQASTNRFALNNQSVREEFASKFSLGDRPTEVQTSILQALTMMNGKLTSEATSLERSETLSAIADAPFLDTKAKIEALHLAALSRQPTTRQLERLTRYVERGGASKSGTLARRQQEALSDVFWALLNSAEFYLNH